MLKIQRPKETQKEKWRFVVENSLNRRWYETLEALHIYVIENVRMLLITSHISQRLYLKGPT